MRERLGRALFERVAGPDGTRHRDRIHGTPGPRWFPLGSPITVVHGDASMYVGGIRAVLLQTLQPEAMTSRFLAVTTFGTAEHAQQAVDAVRAIHDRVNGAMPDGTPYDANDPHLLEWVHVAEIQSFLLAHRQYGARRLDQAGYDEYVAQASYVAGKLGVTDLPTTEAELHAAVERFRPELHASDHAREAVSYLIRHPELPLAARPPYWVLVGAAVGLMPDWTREPLRLPTLPIAHDRVADLLGRGATRTVRWATAGDRAEAARLHAQASASASVAAG
jgi:uncharacterized protein (DUF2236 family)